MKKGYSVDGSLIRKLRKKKKWTQKELGSTVMKKSGLKEISFRTIQRLETEAGYGCSQTIIDALAKVAAPVIYDTKANPIQTYTSLGVHGHPGRWDTPESAERRPR